MKRSILLLACVASLLPAQERKPVPETRKELPAGQVSGQAQLPSFDLPEFVITGRESIDLPGSEKQFLEHQDPDRFRVRPQGDPQVRSAVMIAGGEALSAQMESPASGLGRLYAAAGSHSSFLAGFQAAGPIGRVHVGADAEYYRTAGFAPWTAASDFHADARVRFPVEFFSGFLTGERVSVGGKLERSTYSWYGSTTPSADRSVLFARGDASLSGVLGYGSPVTLSVGYEGGSVVDTSTTVREGIFRLKGDLQGEVLDVPADVNFRILSGGISGAKSGSYGGAEFTVRAHWRPMDALATSVSAGVTAYSGESGQRGTLFRPGFTALFQVDENHRFFGSFAPGVVFRTLSGFVREVPFLTATAGIRHTVEKNRGTFGFESQWGESLRSVIELETAKSSDYPAISDTGSGYFLPIYGEVTETFVKASLVAKLPANHYFSAIAILRSSKSSASGVSVPYLPSSELRLSHSWAITERMSVESQFQVLSSRQTKVIGPAQSIPGYARLDVRGSYKPVAGLVVWSAVQNILDSRIEYWDGYQETPFTLQIGLSYSFLH